MMIAVCEWHLAKLKNRRDGGASRDVAMYDRDMPYFSSAGRFAMVDVK